MAPDNLTGTGSSQPAESSKPRTGLVTLLFTDMVGSTALKQQFGDQGGVALFRKHHQLVRELLGRFPTGQEIETAGDSFLLVFSTPSDAVRFGLLLQSKLRGLREEAGVSLFDRVGIHVGEVVVQGDQSGVKPRELYGIQIDTCSRVMSLAKGGQVLMSRGAFDSARQVLKGEDIEGVGQLEWLNHGPYLLKGLDEPVEVCEVREAGQQTLSPPTSSEKAQRQVRPDEEPVLGWRPAVGQFVPNTRWLLERKLGEGGFGEVWLGRQQATKECRVFKFCFQAERVRFLKRELTLFRVLKERVGDHPHIVRLHDVYLDQPPFYVEMDYIEGSDLRSWCEGQGGVAKVSLETKLEIAAQAAEGLQAAHDAGIIHRDIKPGNILISDFRSQITDEDLKSEIPNLKLVRVKLTDFGIGQVVSEESLKGITRAGFTQTILGSSSTSHTGTQLYMAPELLAGKQASTRSDIYSLGVVLYQILVGDFTRPVTTDWQQEVADPLLREDLTHCFAGNPQDRFAGAGQLAKNLRALPERGTELERRAVEKEALERAAYRRGVIRTASLAGLTIALFALLTVFAFSAFRRARHEATRAEAGEMAARKHLYAADMVLAQQAMVAGNVGRTLELLNKYNPNHTGPAAGKPGKQNPLTPDLRGWEWRHLWHQCRSDELYTLGSHTRAVTQITFAPDGRTLVSCGQDRRIILWDLTTRRIMATLLGENLNSLAFSRDSRTMALASVSGKAIKFFDTLTGRQTVEPLLFDAPVWSFAFSPDGKTLVVLTGQELVVLDADTRSQRSRKQVHWQSAWPMMTFSPDGGYVAIPAGEGSRGDMLTGEGSVILWDMATQSQIAELPAELLETRLAFAGALAFSPDGNLLASAGSRKSVIFWDVKAKQEVKRLETTGQWIGGVAFSPDGKTVAIASANQAITLFDRATWQMVGRLKGHLDEAWCVAFSPDGKLLVSGSKDKTIRVWPATPKPAEVNSLALPPGTDGCILSSDGKTLITLTTSNTFSLWDVAAMCRTITRPLPFTNFSHTERLRLQTFSIHSDGRHLVTSGRDGSVRVFETETLNQVAKLGQLTREVYVTTLSADEKTLAAASGEGVVRLWDLRTQQPIASVSNLIGFVTSLFYSPDHKLLVAGYLSGQAEIWDLSTHTRRLARLGHDDFVGALTVSPNGRTLATVSGDAKVKLWDIRSGEVTATLGGQANAFCSVVISPDGRRIFAGGADGTVKIWDSETYQEVAVLRGHRKQVFSLAFLPDQSTLVSASHDALCVWHAPSLAEIQEAEKSTGE